ncbi:iron-sulfur cluster assembly scaffold protein [Candidatus Manganitrophus noduliformans]|uniref:Iron-sulfur cluster assembly scaffold protein n=1 Tax=Candidatus Manganitrophus noduliformans TaxID=2606439 RepID=A0A7X6DQF7_9BACT|nr:iron-sulfur cluster assembly scaffold protein [Candidatus Manganitrophus noduliformans]NKE71503.1 iron-sulfur cluster assembly scaffold protein [Candidatus Manganitrophus noduliformans]
MIAYGGRILEHYRHPRNAGSLPDPDISYEDVNPLCGDRIRIMLKLAAGETVDAARFRADGCIISQAASSLLTEMVTGRRLDEIETLAPETLLQALQWELRPARIKCALLPYEILQTGIKEYRREHR